MKINYITQVERLESIKVDYFICCSGFESRSSYLFSNNIPLFETTNKFCFQFSDRIVLSRAKNDCLYKENGFTFKQIKIESIEAYIFVFDDIFNSTENKSINIVVDFSSMTTMIYASILKYFNTYAENFIDVSIYFCYTIAEYTTPLISDSLSINQPISIFDTIQTTDKKIALIIGLGYEKDKALGLYEYFQNSKEDIYLFIAKNANVDPYIDSTMENNRDLIKMISEDNIIYYDIENVRYLISSLDSLVTYLVSSDKRVVIAPTGPKQFTLIALLINLIHNDVTTYRVSYGIKSEPIDKIPDEIKKPIITLINFKAE